MFKGAITMDVTHDSNKAVSPVPVEVFTNDADGVLSESCEVLGRCIKVTLIRQRCRRLSTGENGGMII